MEPSAYRTVVEERSEQLLRLARTDLQAPVPTCPGWAVSDLVGHIGVVWGWSAAILRSGERQDQAAAPQTGGDEIVNWAAAQVQGLLDALSVADPDSNCWTFGLPRSRLFWFRRQALETLVHTWDVEHALGHEASLDSDAASDGIDEFLTVMLPRQLARNPGAWEGQTLHLHRTDGDGEWLLHLEPDGSLTVDRSHAKGDVALRGPASSLYLWCMNRVSSDRLEVFGDRAIAQRWAAEIAI